MAFPRVEVGSIVRVEARGSRGSNGETRLIPAVVLGQHPDGSLQLYALHFEGVPSLMNSVPLEAVEAYFDLASLNRRLTELENLTAALAGPLQAQHMKFALADDPH